MFSFNLGNYREQCHIKTLADNEEYSKIIDLIENEPVVSHTYQEAFPRNPVKEEDKAKYYITRYLASKRLDGHFVARAIIPKIFSQIPSGLILSFTGASGKQLQNFFRHLDECCNNFESPTPRSIYVPSARPYDDDSECCCSCNCSTSMESFCVEFCPFFVGIIIIVIICAATGSAP
jgi:hypothetical protein